MTAIDGSHDRAASRRTVVSHTVKIAVMHSFQTVVNAKGQITIPAELRERFGIKPGTRINWTEERGRLVLTPMTERRIREIMGFLKPGPGEPSMFDELFAERERERKRENSRQS